jgi:N-acetyl-gamma-glutamyl-phosphate reductase
MSLRPVVPCVKTSFRQVSVKKVFIDGQEGTTGLEIRERLSRRRDVELLEIEGAQRKDAAERRAIAGKADLVVLCLPDAAAVEAVTLFEGVGAKILDASTAHRTHAGWIYGLPELAPGHREKIRAAKKVSSPGCYPTGFLLNVRPLVDAGILRADYPMTVHALSGYSGGGKKLIAAFAEHDHRGDSPDWTVRPYGLDLAHKHVPEMKAHGLLEFLPVFCPAVGNYRKGMLVSVPLHVRALAGHVSPADVHALFTKRYEGEPFVRVMPLGGEAQLENGYLTPVATNGTNMIELFVFGNAERILLVARLDNLGKGAAGTAVQNLNLMLGLEETAGLA